jgi:hypothetical protein
VDRESQKTGDLSRFRSPFSLAYQVEGSIFAGFQDLPFNQLTSIQEVTPWKNPSKCAYFAPDGTWLFCWEANHSDKINPSADFNRKQREQ